MNRSTILLAAALVAAVGWLGYMLSTRAEVVDDEPVVTAPPIAAPIVAPAAPAAPRITGLVLGPDQRPLSGASVTLSRILSHWPAQELEECAHVLTAADGTFGFDADLEPDLVVHAHYEGFASSREPVPQRSPSVTVQLAKGYSLRGRVVDPSGRPVGDCEVMVEPGPWLNRRAVAVRTRANGLFRFDDLASGLVRVTARHPNFQPVTDSAVELGTQGRVRLKFRKRSLSVSGTVVAGDPPQPVDAAEVRAYPSTWNNELFVPVVAKTDARGRFELRGIGRGNLVVQVWHQQFSTSSRRIPVSGDIDDLEFDLITRSQVSGRLTGEGVEGARLQLQRPGESSLGASVAADGSFAFSAPVSAGRVSLELLDGDLAFEKTGGLRTTINVQESERTEIELPVVRASKVRGRAIDAESGRGIAGVRVSQRLRTRGAFDPQELLAVADAEGRFEVSGLAPVPMTLVFEHQRFAKQQRALQGPRPGEDLELEVVVMNRPGAIWGTVRRGGRVLEGALVFASNTDALEKQTVTSPDGSFRLANLPAGEYSVKAHYGSLPLASSDDTVIVAAGAEVGPVQLAFPGGRQLRGVVVDNDGEAIPNLLVRVVGLPMTPTPVDDAGRFVLEVPRRDLELLVADATGIVERTQPIGAADNDVRVVLPWGKRGSLLARVVGLPGREPVTAGIVRVRPIQRRADDLQQLSMLRPQAVEMPGGRLHLTGVPAGRCRVIVACDGYRAWIREVDVTAGGETDLGSIDLDPGAMLRGIVVDAADRPIAGARVHLGYENDLAYYEATGRYLTAHDGAFELRGVATDWRTLIVKAEGYATRSVAIAIPQDLISAAPKRIVLQRGRRIVVTVQDSAGKGQDLRGVVLMRDGEIVDVAYTDFGTAEFIGREPGHYEVFVPEMTGAARSIDLDDAPGDFAVVLRETAGG